MTSRALLASVVEQPRPDVLPDRMLAIEADRVDSLNLDDAIAAAAGHPQHVARDLG
jgi:hypothetical protein